jgi:hypothetical protein
VPAERREQPAVAGIPHKHVAVRTAAAACRGDEISMRAEGKIGYLSASQWQLMETLQSPRMPELDGVLPTWGDRQHESI